MHNKTLADILAGLNRGDFSSVEITRHFLDRIKSMDGQYNSFISVTEAAALAGAEAADRQRATGDAPLRGVTLQTPSRGPSKKVPV